MRCGCTPAKAELHGIDAVAHIHVDNNVKSRESLGSTNVLMYYVYLVLLNAYFAVGALLRAGSQPDLRKNNIRFRYSFVYPSSIDSIMTCTPWLDVRATRVILGS